MSSSTNIKFTRLRSFFWPIHRFEVKRFLPLLVIYCLICLNYGILKAAKDSLVITAPGSGAEAIPFIKIWVILPMALLITYLFTRLFNRFSQEKVFYIMILSFLAFFLVFTFILYPARAFIHPHELADKLQLMLPKGFKGLISIFRNWSYTLFYVMSELWGTAIMSVLFWGFTNEITSVKEAKRYYGMLSVGANIASILSGQLTILISTQAFDLAFLFGADRWGQSLSLVTFIVTLAGILTIGIFRWYCSKVVNNNPNLKLIQNSQADKKKTIKMGMRKNFSYLAKSKYLICIAVLVIGFNIAINMVEVVWKDQIKAIYPNPNEFNTYMGKVLFSIGCLSTFIGLFFCSNLIRLFGWTFSALITPITLLITGVLFFMVIFFKETSLLIKWTTILGLTPLTLGVFFGTIQNVLSRACKFTVFDTTKEISFIPLSPESKIKGKAAIDGIGSRLGKSGGSIIHGSLLMLFGSVSVTTPYVGLILLVIVLGWIGAVKSLGHQFHQLTAEDKMLNTKDTESKIPQEKFLFESINLSK